MKNIHKGSQKEKRKEKKRKLITTQRIKFKGQNGTR